MNSCILQEVPVYSNVLQCPHAYSSSYLWHPQYCLYSHMPSCILQEVSCTPLCCNSLLLSQIGTCGIPNTIFMLTCTPVYSRRYQCSPLYSNGLLLIPIGIWDLSNTTYTLPCPLVYSRRYQCTSMVSMESIILSIYFYALLYTS